LRRSLKARKYVRSRSPSDQEGQQGLSGFQARGKKYLAMGAAGNRSSRGERKETWVERHVAQGPFGAENRGRARKTYAPENDVEILNFLKGAEKSHETGGVIKGKGFTELGIRRTLESSLQRERLRSTGGRKEFREGLSSV